MFHVVYVVVIIMVQSELLGQPVCEALKIPMVVTSDESATLLQHSRTVAEELRLNSAFLSLLSSTYHHFKSSWSSSADVTTRGGVRLSSLSPDSVFI